MTDISYDAILKVHIPGDVKPRDVKLSVSAVDDADAVTKAKEQWIKSMKPISITITEKVNA